MKKWTPLKLPRHKYLSDEQRAKFLTILQKQSRLISGKLGNYPHKKVDLELLPGAMPVIQKPYPIPRLHLDVFKKKLDQLCEIGVLSHVGATEWAAPTFIIPKKDKHVCWGSDFQELNKVIKRKNTATKNPGYYIHFSYTHLTPPKH